MYHENDFWFWSEPFLEPDAIKDINKTINERYYQVENKNDGAKDRDGKYLKNIEPKHIYYDYFVDILSDFCSKHDIKFDEILRIAINISYYNGVTDKSPVHTDHEFDHNQLLVYLNDPLDKESKTVLLDNNNDVYKEFYPEKYKGVMFSKMPHYVIYPRVGERYILVFTFR